MEKFASQKLGRTVTVGAVDFKPWTLELTLTDLAVARADGSASQLTIQRIYVDAEIESLFRMAPVADAISVEGLNLNLTHLGTGRYDVDDILQNLQQPDTEASKTPSEPLRFAVYNLRLQGASVDFVDTPKNRTHTLRELNLSIPFLSSLDSQRDVRTEPHLAFKLNGSTFDTSADTTPFAKTRKTSAEIRVDALDLTPYLPYMPTQLPVRLMSAVLDADLLLAFEQTPQTVVSLRGTVQAKGVRLNDAQQNPLLSFDALKLGLQDVQPLAHKVSLSSIEWVGPRLQVVRDRQGRINLTRLSSSNDAAKTTPPTTSPQAAAPWQISVAHLGIRQGQLDWFDHGASTTASAPAQLGLHALSLDANEVAYPFAKPLQLRGNADLTHGSKAAAAGQINIDGQATDQAARVNIQLDALPLAALAPYLAATIEPNVVGTLKAALGVDWAATVDKDHVGHLKLNVHDVLLDKFALTQAGISLASIGRIELSDTQLEPSTQVATVGRLNITNPVVKVERDAQHHWMFEKWLRQTEPSATAGRQAKTAGAANNGWKVTTRDIVLSGGNVGWLDRSTPRPARFEVTQLRAELHGFSLNDKRAASVHVAARMGAGRTEPGTLSYRGKLAMLPVSTDGTLEAKRLPLHAVAPYLADNLNIRLLRADTSFKGLVSFVNLNNGPQVRVQGDTAVEEFRANSIASAVAPASGAVAEGDVGEELLSWKLLNLRGLKIALMPGAATTVDVNETTLSDFYARVIVGNDGRINLQDLVKSKAADTTDSSASPSPVIRFGPISLLAGKVYFSDRFVHPNYSADLSDLTGKLSAFSSESVNGVPQLADLELRGRAQGTASLEIGGKLNPLAKPLALDITGKVRDLELPPLTPYAIKYAGHGIERGKLSVDVGYKVLPDGQLTASNKLVLHQLSFGDKVDGAPASLPVKLAVALLADRNGVIDIDLPVSGSLNDPQFRLGPIIFKVIVNLIGKALTSPFSLLSSAMGGGSGEDMSMVSFAPGSATLGTESKQSLDKVAKALADRSALKMTVVGTASLDAERDGYKRERLMGLVRAEQRRARVTSGATPADTSASANAPLTDVQYAVLLKEVYRRADMPKPRNLVGMAKDIPVNDMEALLLANFKVSEDAMQELAVQRGVAVKDYLASKQLPLERLFLGAAKTVAPEAKWTPRAELVLDSR